ncbi:MAG: hypothetical protein EOL97_13890 [Spirochaetia bacterium]|nr:hypothetical protein [Spirochaetia bacterium]
MLLKEIMDTMATRVLNDEPISPASWVESALRVNALKGELDNELIAYELLIADSVAKMIEEGKSGTIADKLCKRGETYKKYLELKAELKRIEEFIRLAKRRATIQEW